MLPRELPADIVDFVGRGPLVAELRSALLDAVRDGGGRDHVPIAVVTGPGGSGKSTLAVHTAHLVHGEFPVGQLFARLNGSTSQPTSTTEVLGRRFRTHWT